MGFIEDFFTYETPKSVVVKSWTVGIINRVMQLLIITYFIGWVFIHEKAYQTKETRIESTVITKVKGFGRTQLPNGLEKVMDVAEYVIPPQGGDVFSIITSTRITENQVQGTCPEDPDNEDFLCQTDDQCHVQMTHQIGSGIRTGRCVRFNGSVWTCEIRGWCPVELDDSEKALMTGAENFTIFIKNSIRFPLFNFSKGNMLPNITKDYMRSCSYHPETDLFCPIFRLRDIVRFASQDFHTLTRKGGVIGIRIEWKCNLDRSAERCVPRYSFLRLDRVSQSNNVSQGYNFRYARFYRDPNGTDYRTLLKAYGIRIDIMVTGQAAKFDIIPTVINMVAAFTSIGLGAVVCDLILLNFVKGADKYKARKFEEVSQC
ncbi:P2X purinoceptor 3b [Chiloscyllium punctatum]|uniref:P2X purinoceptor 3b n=2 Tax=Chiloscyllium TaxID=34767 RepID=UPI003B635132